MIILRFNRNTKASASFRNEIDKLDRKFRVKKKDKDKISALRDSSMRDSRSSRDFVFESESQSESSSQSELAVDSSIVASIAFVASVDSIASVVSIVSVSIDNATLLKMLLRLFFVSFETISFSIDSVTTSVAIFVAILVTNSFSIDSITTFEMIEVVDASNMIRMILFSLKVYQYVV
jgi:K+-sensing histidine kinase KdpD